MKCVNAETALVKHVLHLCPCLFSCDIDGKGLFPPATCSARFISVFRLEGTEKIQPRGTRALG